MKIKTTFICFSDRKKIEKMFKKYCEENYISKSLYNLITFLQYKDMLNTDKIIELKELGWLDE